MHEFILVPATGPYVQQRGCARALYYLAPVVPVVGGHMRGERGREAPRSLLEEKLIEASANIGCSVVLSVAYYRMGPTATPLKKARLLLL